MDNPPGAYGTQSPLNRSYYNHGRIRESQVPLYPQQDVEDRKSNYKPLVWLLFGILTGLLLYSNSPIYYGKLVRFWREKTRRPIQPSHSKDATDPLNCEFKELNFECNDLDNLREKLKAQNSNMQCSISSLPTTANQKAGVQDLLKNPEELEVATGQLSKLNFDETFEQFNELIPAVKVFPNSSNEQVQKAADAITYQTELLKNMERFNDPTHLTNFALDVNSLYLTLRNLIYKRDRLNKYRNELIEMAHQLPNCQKDNDVLKMKIASNESQHQELLKNLNDLKTNIQKKRAEFDDLMNHRSIEKTRLGGEINDLRTRVGQLTSKLSNRATIESQIQGMLNSIESNAAKIKMFEQNNVQLGNDIQAWISQRTDLQSKISSEKKSIAEMETKFKILELQLQLHYRNRSIKDFLEKMIDTRDSTMSEFGSLVNEKLQEEDSIKSFIHEFFKNVEALNQNGGDAKSLSELDNMIKEDKEELVNFASKYMSMVKIIRDYKDTDIQIEILLKRQAEIKGNISAANDRISRMLEEIKTLDYKILEGQNTRDRHAKSIITLGEENTKTQEMVAVARKELDSSQSSLEILQKELERKESEAKVRLLESPSVNGRLRRIPGRRH